MYHTKMLAEIVEIRKNRAESSDPMAALMNIFEDIQDSADSIFELELHKAEKNLKDELGLTLNDLPDKETAIKLFVSMCKQSNLSHEAQTALLYRLVVLNYLVIADVMRDEEENDGKDLLWLKDLVNRSVDWSKTAADHVLLEKLTSQINMNIDSFLKSFGVNS